MNKNPTGLNKPLTPSKELALIVGEEPLPRGQVMKKLWEYIKENNLQNTSGDKRIINPDEKLSGVLGKDPINMLAMAKVISGHLS